MTSLNSGRYCATDAPTSSLFSSAKIIAATVVIGLDIEAIRKMESFFIGVCVARS